jgi:hypothetical protein
MIRKDGTILHLEQTCEVEEAETLLQALLEGEVTGFDLADCRRLHTAVLQLVLAAPIPIVVPPGDPALMALLLDSDGAAGR